MKRNAMVVPVAILAMSLVLVACGGGGPDGTVKGYYNAMNAGKYSEAVEYLGPMMAEIAKFDGGKAMSDEMTHNGTMTKVEIVESSVRGEGADVKVRIHFKDGAVDDQDFSLVKQDGKWKIADLGGF